MGSWLRGWRTGLGAWEEGEGRFGVRGMVGLLGVRLCIRWGLSRDVIWLLSSGVEGWDLMIVYILAIYRK